MGRFLDLSVTVDSSTMSPPSTNMRLEVTPHNRGPGFWQVSSVHQSLHTRAHIDSPLHVFKRGDIVLLRTDWTDKMYGTWPDYFDFAAPARFFATV
jgi:kynurenine formamidase